MSRRSPLAYCATLCALACAAAAGCDNSEECAQLRDLHYDHQRALAIARARAGLAEKTKADADEAEERAKKVLAQYGLDVSEDDITATLEERAASIPGASVSKSVRPAAVENPKAPAQKETVWNILLPTSSFGRAAQHAKDLAALPPLMRLSTLLPRKQGWTVELVRIVVDRLPIKFKPTPLPIPKDPAEIPSKLGFCGASELRQKIADARKELETLKVEAAQATVHLPATASWEGLRLRVKLAVELESEARRLLDVFFTAARRAKVDVETVGQQDDVVVLTVAGGQRQRNRVERLLPEDVLQSVRFGDKEEGVVRFIAPNRVAERAQRPDREQRPKGVDLGLPTPDKLKEEFDRARKKMLEEQNQRP